MYENFALNGHACLSMHPRSFSSKILKFILVFTVIFTCMIHTLFLLYVTVSFAIIVTINIVLLLYPCHYSIVILFQVLEVQHVAINDCIALFLQQ